MNLSRKIYKYAVPLGSLTTVELPHFSFVVAAGVQNGIPHMWVDMGPYDTTEKRQFYIVGTGHEYAKEDLYTATFFDGPFVWHLIEATKL